MTTSFWTVAAASVRGRGHEQTGTPCQDSSAVHLSPNGKWVALVASDGAGTAKFSDQGSKLVTDEVAKSLIRLSEECECRAPGAWVSDRVIRDIVAVRERLRDLAGSDNISDYHCTLSAALLGPTGGLTIHLGDGAIFGGAAGTNKSDVIDLADDHFVSVPQNGEYANETVFLTEREWVRNLRIHPVSTVDWVMLGTDGGMALAMVGESQPKSGFVVPVIRALINESDFTSRCRALSKILDDRQADRLTNDDKTLIVAIRPHFLDVTGEFGFNANQSASGSTTSQRLSPGVTQPGAQSSGRAQTGTVAQAHSNPSQHQASPVRVRSSRRRWVIWTAVVLLMAVLLVVGVLMYRAMNPSGVPVLPPASKKATAIPAELGKSVEVQATDPAISAASASPAAVALSKQASTHADEKIIVPTPGDRSSKETEQQKSQK